MSPQVSKRRRGGDRQRSEDRSATARRVGSQSFAIPTTLGFWTATVRLLPGAGCEVSRRTPLVRGLGDLSLRVPRHPLRLICTLQYIQRQQGAERQRKR